jgi:hypothetical protein
MEKKISDLLTQMINGIAELNRSNQRLFVLAVAVVIVAASLITCFAYEISRIGGR